MAAQFDAMGNYIGDYETDEERRIREEQEARAQEVAHKATVTTRNDGSQTVSTTQEIPQAQAVPAAGAVNPADVFNRIIQAESGGQQNGPNGQILTSPKGAQGMAQIMPATAANPGYGVRPASPEEIATPEGNRAFGERYFQGLLKHFDGDVQKATAAYNGGPGRVGKNIQANAGQLNMAQMPQETQQYVQKVLGPSVPGAQPQMGPAVPPPGANTYTGPGQGEEALTVSGALSPGEQVVAPAPVAGPAVPGQPGMQIDDNGNKLITNADGTTTLLGPDNRPMMAGGQVPTDTAQYRNRLFEEAGKDPMKWLAISQNPDLAQLPGLQTVAKQQAGVHLRQEFDLAEAGQKAEKLIESATKGDKPAGRAIANELQKQDGSWLKMILLGFLSPQLAGEEAVKLGFGNKWTSVQDENGKSALIQVNAKGMPLQGISADNNPLTQDELAKFGAGGFGTSKTKPDVSLQDVEKGGMKGRVVTTYDKQNRPTTMVNVGSKMYPYDSSWKPTSIETAGAKAEASAAVKLKYAGPTSYTEAGAKAAGEFNFNNGTNIGYQSQQPGAPLVDLNTGKPVQVGSNGVITTTQTGTPGTAPAPAASGQTPAQIATATGVNKVAQEQFVKTTAPAVNEEGTNGRAVASIRRQQLSSINSNPSILNIFNGTGTNYDRARNVITKLVTGAYGEENSGDFYKDTKNLGLTEGERSALEDFALSNMAINSKTLKANSGAGAVSNAEQKANQNANLQNLAETTPLGALQGLHRSQFTGDMASAKADFLSKNPTLNDDTKFNGAWAKESAKMTKAYEGIIEARAEYLKAYRPGPGAKAAELNAFKDKTFKAFEMYPAPQYNVETGSWNYQTANAERAAAKKLLGR